MELKQEIKTETRGEIKATGFASPAMGYEADGIDLNRLLIQNPPATFFARLDSGDMAGLGLPRGALLIVDRSKEPGPGAFALIRQEGQFLCRLMLIEKGRAIFTNGISDIIPDGETEIVGTVTASVKTYDNAD